MERKYLVELALLLYHLLAHVVGDELHGEMHAVLGDDADQRVNHTVALVGKAIALAHEVD